MKVDVMNGDVAGDIRLERHESVRPQIDPGPVLSQNAWQDTLEPEVPEYRMPCRWGYHQGYDVVPVHEFRGKRPVEQEKEGMFRMVHGDPPEVLMHEPADPFKPVAQEQTSIYSDDHTCPDSPFPVFKQK